MWALDLYSVRESNGLFTLAVSGTGTETLKNGCMVLCRTFHTAPKQWQGRMGYVPIFQVLKLFQVVCSNGISMAFRCSFLVRDTASVKGFCMTWSQSWSLTRSQTQPMWLYHKIVFNISRTGIALTARAPVCCTLWHGLESHLFLKTKWVNAAMLVLCQRWIWGIYHMQVTRYPGVGDPSCLWYTGTSGPTWVFRSQGYRS